MSLVRVQPGEPDFPTVFDAPIGCPFTHSDYIQTIVGKFARA